MHDPLTSLKAEQKLACLSVRLCLDFTPHSARAQSRELDHVEKYLRVAMIINHEEGMVRSMAPSEPILAEAAKLVMVTDKRFKPADALSQEFRRPDIERGPRGETLVQLMSILAADEASNGAGQSIGVVDFFEKLFNAPSNNIDDFGANIPSTVHPDYLEFGARPFKEAFKDAKMHFNHFVKATEHNTLHVNYLWRAAARGAAIICANNQAGIDLVHIFTYSKAPLGRNNIGVILWQVKNDKAYTAAPRPHLFDEMDPIKLDIFENDGSEIPVIRIITALASDNPTLINFAYGDKRNSKAGGTRFRGPKRFTAYDFYCAGLDPLVWRPVYDAVDDFKRLLDASGAWDRLAKSKKEDKDMRNSRLAQAPCAGVDYAHWSNWTTFDKN